uniref:PLAC domain-containing protein n=1 Tax=Gopherus agassizii TaxID=38772 RepID=A0A452GKF0_9SAUR
MLTGQVCAPQPSWLPFSPVFWLLFPLLWSLPRYQLSCCRIQEALFAQIFPSVPAPETWAEAAPWAPNATPEPWLLDQALRCVPQRTSRQVPEEDEAGNQVAGAWSSWGPWSSCSQPCGVGVLERVRTCLPPYQRAPWGGPHGPHTYAQPLYPEERPNPYPPRPSYPLHTDGDSRHGALGSKWVVSPTQESRAARRSRIRESIKPGKYGYGKVPFALPLHKEVAEGGTPRFKRHPGPSSDQPPPSELAGHRARPRSGGDGPAPHHQPHTAEQGSAEPLKAEATAKPHTGSSEDKASPGENREPAAAPPEPQGTQHRTAEGTPQPGPSPTEQPSLFVGWALAGTVGPGGGEPMALEETGLQESRPKAGAQAPLKRGDGDGPGDSTGGTQQPSHLPCPTPGAAAFQIPGCLYLTLVMGTDIAMHAPTMGSSVETCVASPSAIFSCIPASFPFQPCPADQPDARAVQCAAFNTQEFMGRLYQWEPFTDVRGSQRCELNCRPVGFRFYVRHTEKVQDGTPCEAASLDICVAGECLSPGCDGVLGSNRTLDSCGVCGGDHSTCKLVVGNFSDSNVPIGYHKILQIPQGATRINVTEMTQSPNYLALRSRSGKSLINGNWAVDPPGRYEAGGTVFIYTRPGHEEPRGGGESLTAEGPTTEPIDVYVSTEGGALLLSPPGALTMLSPSDQLVPPTSYDHPMGTRHRGPAPASQSRRTPGTLQRNVRVIGVPSAVSMTPVLYGTLFPSPPRVSAGLWQPVFRCAARHSQEEVEEEQCADAPKPPALDEACNTQPCPAYWDMGEWSACSKSCGPGTQHRQVLCRQTYANRSTMVHPQHCSQLDKPSPTQPCQLRVCSHWEVRTNWSCSVLCGLGHRTRHIRCISNHGDLLSDGECNGSHRPPANEACDMGPCVRSWFHSDWSNTCSVECGTGIQRRSVVCLSSYANGQVEETCAGTKPADMRACNSGPCHRTVKWYTGPWSECSADCGTGTQRRDVICVSKLGSEFNVTEASECAPLEKPPSLQPCTGSACDARWFSTSWSACSKSCVGGVQVREVQCLTQNKTFSNLCQPDLKPIKKRSCNTQPCTPDLGENCRDKYHNCPVVVQARLCVYSYYKLVCCASCTRAVERSKDMQSR